MNSDEHLLDTLKSIRQAPDDDAVIANLTNYASQFGLNFVYIAQFLNPDAPLPAKWVSATNWPAQLLAERREKQSYLHDPVVRMGLHAPCPFTWDHARKLSGDAGKIVMNEASGYNLSRGIMFPIRMFDLPPGGVSLGGTQCDLSRIDQSNLELAAREAYFRLLDIAEPENWFKMPKLSRRESEILTKIAEGLSNQLVAEELGICTDTVKDTLKRCYRKLGVKNRTEAVKQALMTLQILPLPTLKTPPNG